MAARGTRSRARPNETRDPRGAVLFDGALERLESGFPGQEGQRRVHFAGVSARPSALWITPLVDRSGRSVHANHTASKLLHVLSTDNPVERPIGALDQHVGAQGSDGLERCVFVVNEDSVDALKSEQRFRPFLLSDHGPALALEAPHRGVRVDADDQNIPVGSGLLQEMHMARVKDVETPVRKHHASAEGPESGAIVMKGFQGVGLARRSTRSTARSSSS